MSEKRRNMNVNKTLNEDAKKLIRDLMDLDRESFAIVKSNVMVLKARQELNPVT